MVYEMRKKELGPENPDTLQIKGPHCKLADILYKEKRYVSALKFFLTLEKKTAFLGSKHFLVKNCHEHIDCISAHFKALGEERLVDKLKNDVRQTSENKINSFTDLSNNVEMGESNLLQEVVAKGETEKLKILLERGVDVLQVFEGGNTALHVAAAQGQSATADILLRHCQDSNQRILQNVVNATNDEGSTPLHVAVDVKTVKCLLKHGALYDAKNKANRTPLDLCKVEEIRSLLETVEDLFSSVQNGKGDDMVGKLESLDSDVAVAATRARNSSGKTLLLVALQTNRKDLAEELGKWLKRQKCVEHLVCQHLSDILKHSIGFIFTKCASVGTVLRQLPPSGNVIPNVFHKIHNSYLCYEREKPAKHPSSQPKRIVAKARTCANFRLLKIEFAIIS
ncbi:uncharacterized protein CDAR_461141 [Caerostris darwini]|uniref:Uncharacterized protein n=1 Tax=Caerostris darwini TaxID=1538125 RepID=A0AAV4S8V7_9ARAC|nr:uncharacterized protein CDAR_461141 [Caerostris darwini]